MFILGFAGISLGEGEEQLLKVLFIPVKKLGEGGKVNYMYVRYSKLLIILQLRILLLVHRQYSQYISL